MTTETRRPVSSQGEVGSDHTSHAVDRLARPPGSRIGRGSLHFTFDGREFMGRPGDTAASALLRNGVRLFARSIKYRRPRGILTAGIEEPNALLTVGQSPNIVPNVPAPVLTLHDGMQLRSQNRWPSLQTDVLSFLGLGGRLLGAGFYYKTFKWPAWRMYEPFIRRLAGLGPAPGGSDLCQPSLEHLDCDVLVVGAGASGIEAARVSSACGARVIVCEREPLCGGELEFEEATIDGTDARSWLIESLDLLRQQGVRILTETAVVGNSDRVWIAHCYPGGLPHSHGVYRIRAKVAIIATGAVEHGIVFEGNDRPGVMLLSAAERYLARYGVIIGKRLVLFGNHDRLYCTATRFMAVGARIAAIIDTRASSCIGTNRARLQRAGVTCLDGHAVLRAMGGRGLRGVIVAPLKDMSRGRGVPCDALLVSGGWAASRLAAVLQGSLTYRGELGQVNSAAVTALSVVCGAAAGCVDLDGSLADGNRAAHSAVRACGAARKQKTPARAVSTTGSASDVQGAVQAAMTAWTEHSRDVALRGRGDPDPRVVPFWRSPSRRAAEKRQFVDFQNDVTVADLRQALAEGFIDIEHIKRYTTLGVGTEQGSISAPAAVGILAELTGSLGNAGRVSRARPPTQPVTLATLALHRRGHTLRPERQSPLHAWHLANGGVLESMGLWMRPRYYRASGSDARSAGVAEASQVRSCCGLADGSTLGKIEIAGSSAAEFLDRLYLTRISNLAVGRSRYAVLLREDGMVLDDGLVLRVARDRFFATVSSTHTELILAHMEFWCAVEYGSQDVMITDLTDASSVLTVAGPSARGHLSAVLDAPWQGKLASLKHMEFADDVWNGRALRVLRASFSGELAFELHCHPAIALPLWEGLIACGATPYGLEALDILRLEKGYLVSAEINGQTTPHDLNLTVPADCKCIGSPLLGRPGLHEPDRPRIVGVLGLNSKDEFSGGAQLVDAERPTRPCGYITSAGYSPSLRRHVGLALAARRISLGSELSAREPLYGRTTRVRLTLPAHFDPAGERMKS